jgi:mRNA-binding protein PUF3
LAEKLLGQLKGTERECFVEDIRPQLLLVKKYSYGKQITAIEKLISTSPSPPSSSHGTNPNMTTSAATRTMPLDINSPAATPVLTMEQNSPESSSLPSANASTIDGPTQQGTVKSGAVDTGMPEVRIETVQ